MMKQGTYNVNFFFPQDIKRSIAEQLIGNKELIFSKHCIERQNREAFLKSVGKIDIRKFTTLQKIRGGKIVEATVDNNKVNKFIVRIPSEVNEQEVCLVVGIKDNKLIVVTFYANHKNYSHNNLDRDKYIMN